MNSTTLQKKIVIVKEELDGIDIDDIVNLEDLLRIVFIHEECENLVFVDGGDIKKKILEILTNRRSQAFYKLIDVHSMTYVIGENISSIRMWNIVNHKVISMIFVL